MFYDEYEPGAVMYCKQCYADRPTQIGSDGSVVSCEVCGYHVAPLDSRDAPGQGPLLYTGPPVPGMPYERTVTAALAETASKFALAEALALDIPPHRGNDGDTRVRLAAARWAIIGAGGEPRAIETLANYRRTAQWAIVGNSPQWVPGASFSAHDEARKNGMTYDEFVALPSRTVDAVRREAGRAGTDGSASSIAAAWSPEQKGEAIREMLADPDQAEAALAAAGNEAMANAAAAESRLWERENLERPRPEPRPRGIQEELDDHVIAIMKYRAICRYMQDWAAVLQRSEIARSDPEAWVSMIRGLHNRLDVIEGIVGGQSLDADLAALLGGAE